MVYYHQIEPDSWVLFDDDELIPKTSEDVLALSGGGDWHMAYLLLYKAVLVPSEAQLQAAAEAGAAAAAAKTGTKKK
jgi:ubiquitin carboxyl-terminal hydrolase 14